MAIAGDPELVFLDEPTVGLDPQVRRKLWDLIKNLNGEGLTVLLTTHYIEEAEQLCRRVAIMDNGRLIACDAPANLCQRVGNYVVEWNENGSTRYCFFDNRLGAGDFAGELAANATVRRSNLEDVFVELTGKKVADE